jgi:hypothetical protein
LNGLVGGSSRWMGDDVAYRMAYWGARRLSRAGKRFEYLHVSLVAQPPMGAVGESRLRLYQEPAVGFVNPLPNER